MGPVVPGYHLVKELFRGRRTTVYRGTALRDRAAVVVKVSTAGGLSGRDALRLRREFEMTSSLAAPGAVRPLEVVQSESGLAIVFADDGMVSLDRLMKRGRLSLAACLTVGARAAEVLAQLHAEGVVHKDIKPSNILVSDDLDRVKITDFGIASRHVSERQHPLSPSRLEGTLAYMAPEQTGRVARGLGPHSDLYAIGVTLYQMLTGKLPFGADDAMELIHCHIAVAATPVHVRVPEVPPAVSAIVARLMAKTAEERYRSALGLQADLETALRQLQQLGRIDEFALGREDIPTDLRVPEQLFGRDPELAILQQALDAACRGGRELALVAGAPGIGKSALITELLRPLLLRGAAFGAGKFEQYKRDIPYHALVQALAGLFVQLSVAPLARQETWREAIFRNTRGNGRVLTELASEAELLIGPQPIVEALPPPQAEARFSMVLRGFLRAVADEHQPVVLFLDDLQWSDAATLRVLESVLEDSELTHFLLLAAYRDADPGTGHSTVVTRGRLQSLAQGHWSVELGPLGHASIVQMLAATFCSPPERLHALARSIHDKTGGNPFFVHQFLVALCRKGLVTLDTTVRQWTWDEAAIAALPVTDNVVDLVCQRIAALDVEVRDTITAAACLGATFGVHLLARVREKSVAAVARALGDALQTGLVRPLDASWKYLHLDSGQAPDATALGSEDVAFAFVHDRIQQAAASLLQPEQAAALHVAVGRLLLADLRDDDPGDRLFPVVEHLNPHHARLTPQERAALAVWNLRAAHRALASTAWDIAASCARAGIDLLAPDAWQRTPELPRDLYMAAAQSAFLCGDFENSDRLLSVVFERTPRLVDKMAACQLQVVLYNTQIRLEEAVAAGLRGLALAGLSVPSRPGPVSVGVQALRLRHQMRGALQDLESLPEMTRAEDIAACDIVTSLGPVMYFLDQNLLAWVVSRIGLLVLTRGVSASAAFVLSSLVFVWVKGFDDYELADEVSSFAVRLQERIGRPDLRGAVGTMYGGFAHSWRHRQHTTRPILARAFDDAAQVGDLTFAGYASNMRTLLSFTTGEPVDDALRLCEDYLSFSRGAHLEFSIGYLELARQTLRCLQGATERLSSLDAPGFDEAAFVERCERTRHATLLFHLWLYKGQLHHHAGEHRLAWACLERCARWEQGVLALQSVPEHVFYRGLTAAALCDDPDAPVVLDRRGLLRVLKAAHARLGNWADHCPANQDHKRLLLEAEIARLGDNHGHAVRCYDRAIDHAWAGGFPNNAAIAAERAALYHLGRGSRRLGRVYVEEAINGHARWGAYALARRLSEVHVDLLGDRDKDARAPTMRLSSDATLSSVDGGAGQFDLLAVLRASQELSGEVVLERLLDRLMRIVLETAGASAGVLALGPQDALVVRATAGKARSDAVGAAVELCADLPASVATYVARTRATVVLDDARTDERFVTDPHIAGGHVRSLLCVPLIRHAKFDGLLYLENDLTPGAFPRERVELLNMLAVQIAISIENASLYAALEQKVAVRTEELERALEEITLLSNTDALTGIPNRRSFFEALEREVKRSRRYHRPLALLVLDLDHFKRVNDSWGHQVGDRLLEHVAAIIGKTVRNTDAAGRIGGEEFAVVLTETNRDQAAKAAERLRRALAAAPMAVDPAGERTVTVTVSIGVCAVDRGPWPERDVLYGLADTALYRAKNAGRDQIAFASWPPSSN